MLTNVSFMILEAGLEIYAQIVKIILREEKLQEVENTIKTTNTIPTSYSYHEDYSKQTQHRISNKYIIDIAKQRSLIYLPS